MQQRRPNTTKNKYINKFIKKKKKRLRAPNAGGTGSIPGQGTRIPYVAWHGKNKQTNKQTMIPRKHLKEIGKYIYHRHAPAKTERLVTSPDHKYTFTDDIFQTYHSNNYK